MQSINISPQLLKQLKKNATDAIQTLIHNELRRKINKYEYLIRNFEKNIE